MHTYKPFFQSYHEEEKLSLVIQHQKSAKEYASELANKSARLLASLTKVLLHLQKLLLPPKTPGTIIHFLCFSFYYLEMRKLSTMK